MKTPVPPLQPGSTPDTFRLVGWKVFVPGYHKGQLYTGDDCKKAIRNFGLLSVGDSPALRVKAKFGHDAEQRIAKSLGVMNAGLVTDCRPTDDGGFALDVDGIPATLMIPAADTGEPVAFDLKAAFENGNVSDGSVEFAWDTYPDPANPAEMLDGPVLEAVAFLGEERPGVPGLPPPVATFAAGPKPDNNRARAPRRRRVVFSEVDPMPTRDELLASLKDAHIDPADPDVAGMSDAELATLLKTLSSDAFAAAMKQKYAAPAPAAPTPPAADPAPDKADPMAAMSAQFAAFTAACDKRFAALEQSAKATEEAIAPAKMAAQFAAEVVESRTAERDRVAAETVDRAVREGRLMPHAKAFVLEDLKRLPFGRREAFAAGHAHAGRTPFDVACADLLARPAHGLFAEAEVVDPGADGLVSDDFVRRAALNSPGAEHALNRLAAK